MRRGSENRCIEGKVKIEKYEIKREMLRYDDEMP